MPASQYARHALHCALGSTSSISHSSVFPAALIMPCDSLLKGLNCRRCLKITLKCLSMRVVLDLLNQVVNVDAMWSFHCQMRHSWNIEVNVLLVDCTIELVVRVEWRNVTIFFRSKLFFHCVCAVELLRSSGCPDPSWACLTLVFSDKLRASITLSVISGCPVPSETQRFLVKTFFN